MDLFSMFSKKQKSGAVAKNRLHLVLIQDRLNTSPELIEMLKSDILKVLANYVEIDQNELDINMGDSEEGPALIANIPIKSWKKR